MDKRIKSIEEVFGLLGEQMEQLRPSNKPTREHILAAKTAAHVVDSYLAAVMTCMEYSEKIGEKPNFEFMEIGNGDSKETHLRK